MQTFFQGDHNCLHLTEIVQLGHKWLSRLVGLVLLLHRLLDDVVGSVDDVGLGLAVVLLLAVAEAQGTLAAQPHYVGIIARIIIEVVKKSKVKISRWRCQLPSSCRSCSRKACWDMGLAWRWTCFWWEWTATIWWTDDAELEELRERTHPSHLHTLPPGPRFGTDWCSVPKVIIFVLISHHIFARYLWSISLQTWPRFLNINL